MRYPSTFSSIAIDLNVPHEGFNSIAIELNIVRRGHGLKNDCLIADNRDVGRVSFFKSDYISRYLPYLGGAMSIIGGKHMCLLKI